MATMKFATAIKDNILTQVKNGIDAGAGPGTIKVYKGTQPALITDVPSGSDLLGTLTFSDPCGVISSGVLTMSAITQDSSADASGTATWARIADSTGSAVCDVNVTITGGGGTIQLNTTNIVIGGPILISSAVLNVT